MSIEIDPQELGFHRPFTNEVSQVLKIKNPNQTPVAFKVKTTAPKQYCVRPNCGRIEAGGEVEVTVLLQAMKQDPPLDSRCRDKFLVQSVAVTGDPDSSVGGPVWQSVDDAEKTAIQEKKLKVVYLEPLPAASRISPVTPMKNGAMLLASHEPEGASPAFSSGRSPSPETSCTSDNRVINRQTFGISSSVEARNPAPKINTTTPSIPTLEEAMAKLSKAEETIASLSQDESLRRRKEPPSKETSIEAQIKQAQSVQHSSQGVPLKIVAVLCFTSFLLAYLLF